MASITFDQVWKRCGDVVAVNDLNKAIFGCRPEDLSSQRYPSPGITPAPLKAKVDVTELMGKEIYLYLLTGKKQFVARVDPRTTARVGETLDMVVNMDNMHLFDPQTEKTLDL